MNRDHNGYPIELRTHYAQQYAASTATAQNKGKEPCDCELHFIAEYLPKVQRILGAGNPELPWQDIYDLPF